MNYFAHIFFLLLSSIINFILDNPFGYWISGVCFGLAVVVVILWISEKRYNKIYDNPNNP